MAKISPELGAYSVNSFCEAHSISRPFLYGLWKTGRGPKFFLVGARRLISVEAAEKWRRQCERETAAA